MKFKLPIRACIAIILTFAVCTSVTTAYFLKNKLIGIDYNTVTKISEISNLVEKEYYLDIDSQKLSDSIVSGYVNGLGDKYAAYYSLDTSSAQMDSINGDTHGIGIIAVEDPITRDIFVWRVYRDSPAESAGIKSGDHIINVNGEKVTEIGFTAAVNKIQGGVGKKSKLTLSRGNKTFTAEVECAETDMQSVYSYVPKGTNIGVVQVIDFNKKTYPQFKAEVSYYVDTGAEGLIIDLRHNNGGTVDTAAEMLDYLLPECNTIHVKYKDGKVQVRDTSDASSVDLPIVILTDGNTISASEIFTSVMKQQENVTVIGQKTYGKSLIQRTYKLSDGSLVKFTIGEFVPATGESYNGIGITPDIVIEPEYTISYNYYFLTPDKDKVLAAAIKHLS